METHQPIPYLGEIIVVLMAAGILVPLFHRLKISPVLGYLAAGFLIGPFGLSAWLDVHHQLYSYLTINDPRDVTHLAEFGIVFLMFMIGLELSPQRLWAMRKLVFGLGTLQVSCSILVLTWLSMFFFTDDLITALIMGCAMALSSTAIVMQILTDRRLISAPVGRSAFSILLFQDIAVVPVLIFIGLVGAGAVAGEGVGEVVIETLVKIIAAIVILLLFGHFLLRPIFRLAGTAHGAEPFMAVTFLTVLLTAAVTEYAGLSMALGAFLGGLLLAETEYRHAIEVYIEPFKGLLLGLFFMTVGMGIDPGMIRIDAEWIALSVVGLIVIKAIIVAGLAQVFGLSKGSAIEAGLLLGPAGEFAFVILGAATAAQVILPSSAQFLSLVAGLSMVMTPLIAILGKRIYLAIDRKNTAAPMPETPESVPEMRDHIIIAGFGRVGRAVANMLEAEGVNYLAIEANAQIVADYHNQRKKPVIYGNLLNRNFLDYCHPESALAILVTMADTAIAAQIVETVKTHWPELPIYTRARDLQAAKRLKRVGSTVVVAETIEASLQLGSNLLLGIGTEDDVVNRRLELTREYAINRIEEGG